MRWCRIRFVLLGLLLCVVHVVSGTCGQRFTDPASSALLSDVVIEGKVRKTPESQPGQIYNITVAIRKRILKGAKFVGNGISSKKITIGRFKNGGRDSTHCVGSVQEGRTYFFFLKDTSDPKGLHFQIVAMPVKKSKKLATELRRILCENCTHEPNISRLTGSNSIPTGGNATLLCVAEAKPNPEFSWYKDGVLIPVTKRGHVQIRKSKRQSRLQIKKVNHTDAGKYECVADNAIGQDRSSISMKVTVRNDAASSLALKQETETTTVLPATDQGHTKPCKVHTFCLNGGSCYMVQGILIEFCMCPEQWAGRRCELLDAISVRDDYNHQATILFERTLIIIGIVIALLVFIIICIASYILAKNRRRRFENRRRKRREAENAGLHQPSVLVDRSIPQARSNKESERRNENIAPNLASKQPHQIMLHNSSSPAMNQPHGHTRPQQSDMKVDPNGFQHESRQTTAASSVYENLADPKLSAFSCSEDFQPIKSTASSVCPESIEMKVLQEANDERSQMEKSDESSICGGMNISKLNVSKDSAFSVLPVSVVSLSHPSHTCGQNTEASPHTLVNTLTSSEPQPPSLSQATLPHQQLQDDASPKEENDTAVQYVLANDENSFSIENLDQPTRPFDSRNDKNLYRYLLLGSVQDFNHDRFGLVSDNPESNYFVALPHSNTFPVATKVNGAALEMYSESDEEDETEVPYVKQLHISEEELGISDETLENRLFLGENTPTRQRSREEWVIGLLPSVGLTRPGMRKYQSEEGPAYSRLVNKSIAILEDATRSRSLEGPSGLGAESHDPRRMNSTMAGSPDVETYDNFLQQPSQPRDSVYAYDPTDDSPPWDDDVTRTDLSHQTTEDRENLNRLKDVLPDQQPIPV